MVDDVVVFSGSLSVDASVDIEAVLATAVDDSSMVGTIKPYKYKIYNCSLGIAAKCPYSMLNLD